MAGKIIAITIKTDTKDAFIAMLQSLIRNIDTEGWYNTDATWFSTTPAGNADMRILIKDGDDQ